MKLRFLCLAVGLALSAGCLDWSASQRGLDANGGSAGGPSGPSANVGSGPHTAATSSGAGPATTGTTSGVGPTTTAGTTSGSGNNAASSTSTGPDPYNTPPICTSMTIAPAGNNAFMKPGEGCQTCHVLGGAASGKTFDVSGTVYPTAHEPNDCNGVNVSNAVVIITDAHGADTQLPVNSSGNFYHYDLFGFGALAKPLKARVVYNNQTRDMVAAITPSGDCNSCHTENGAQNAPGRIMLP